MSSEGLSTTEALVIDGANGVTRAPRLGFPDAGWQLALGVVVLLAALVVGRTRLGSRRAVLAAVLLAGAGLGLVHVAVLRADAPLARWQAASPIVDSMESLARVTPWPAPIAFSREDDDVTFPLTRYAAPTRAAGTPAVTLDVRGTTFPVTCLAAGTSVTCEGPK